MTLCSRQHERHLSSSTARSESAHIPKHGAVGSALPGAGNDTGQLRSSSGVDGQKGQGERRNGQEAQTSTERDRANTGKENNARQRLFFPQGEQNGSEGGVIFPVPCCFAGETAS